MNKIEKIEKSVSYSLWGEKIEKEPTIEEIMNKINEIINYINKGE